ncbi:MAG: gliding motility-associated C-terminal domain-containing protein [Flavobacteriales bacterium]|nr:gliding motility-associated C-terminal domain-containing protein [Flavobacteriales bacterium]
MALLDRWRPYGRSSFSPFEQFATDSFTLDLSLSQNFNGDFGWTTYYFNNPCVVQVFGFSGNCPGWMDQELLWASPVLTNFSWQTFTVTFTPALNTYSRMFIRPFFTPPTNFQNSAALIDNLARIVEPDVPDEPDEPIADAAANALFVPNVFTPNGDDANSTWAISGTNIAALHASIYNRWGAPVYTCRHLGDAWTGRDNDGDCPSGIYYFVATVVYTDGQASTERGTITLLR